MTRGHRPLGLLLPTALLSLSWGVFLSLHRSSSYTQAYILTPSPFSPQARLSTTSSLPPLAPPPPPSQPGHLLSPYCFRDRQRRPTTRCGTRLQVINAWLVRLFLYSLLYRSLACMAPAPSPPHLLIPPPPLPNWYQGNGEQGDGAEPAVVTTPGLRALLRFTLPTLGIWLCTPIISLVDTSVVGLKCGPIALASMGPATNLCDSFLYIFSFLAVATTNLISQAGEDHKESQKVVRGRIKPCTSLLGS